MIKRQLFICNAIPICKEKANCCPHKNPHIKDERCVPKLCRYGPADRPVDCEPYDPNKKVVAEAEKIANEGEFIPLEQAAKDLAVNPPAKTVIKDERNPLIGTTGGYEEESDAGQ